MGKTRRARPFKQGSYKHTGPKIQKDHLCTRCDQEVWKHRRCTLCDRFVWCPAVAPGEPHRHIDCTKVTGEG